MAAPIIQKKFIRCCPGFEKLGFDQLNIDLIAGMIGETWDTWRDSVKKTIDIAPDSVTIYQMELPFNTVYSKDYLKGRLHVPIADWQTKRAWHEYAFDEFASAGYEISSAYTMVKKGSNAQICVSRFSVAWLRHVRNWRGFVWTHERCAYSECRWMGFVY